MDFMGCFPTTKKGHDCIFVIVDQFSKMCILIPCKKIIKASGVTELFLANVWIHFGFPSSIVLDRDSRFLGKFWSALWEKMDMKLKRSTTSHPQTDGKTEVVNCTLVQLLRGYNRKHPRTWDENLVYIQHFYNMAVHASTSRTPFETCFGYLPKSSFDVVLRLPCKDNEKLEVEVHKVEKFIGKI